MTKSSVTAEEKERLRREEMERLRNNFLSIRPDNDKALDNDLRRQNTVPLSPQDLFLKESAEVLPSAAVVDILPQNREEQEAPGNRALASDEDTTKAPKPRFPTASVASPTTAV